MAQFKTIWINFGIYTGTILWTIVATLLSPFAYLLLKTVKGYSKVEAVRRLVWVYGRVWIFLTSLFVPIDCAQGIPPSPCVMVFNHASFFDTYIIAAQPIKNICLSIRDWPYKIPFYRPFMEAAQYVRTESAEPGQALEQAVQAVKDGSTIVFFPEGTRSADGKLGRFHSGAFYVALKANVPVVPVCISGNHEFLPEERKRLTIPR